MPRHLEAVGASEAPHDDHVVRFYDEDPELIAALEEFLLAPLLEGCPAIVIATADHTRALERSLVAAGIDLGELETRGRYVALDAEILMGRVIRNGRPDEAAFRREIGGALETLRGPGTIQAFGELVALLWERGNVGAAIRVEELWNELTPAHTFRLLCAYPMRGFETYPDPLAFEEVCAAHTRVVPPASYSQDASEDNGFSRVVTLEQRSRTDRLESEALKLKQAQLEEALERVASLESLRNEFVAMAVHDIRTPAAVVAGFLQVLRKNWRAFDETAAQDLLTKGIHQTKRIQNLVDDMLTIAEIDSGGFTFRTEVLDMTAVIDEAVTAARSAAPDISFVVDVPHLPRALGDESRQIQILNNLLSNAGKFSPRGSTVTIEVSERRSDLLVRITDEGIGIPSEDIPRLFKTFARLRQEGYENVKGTGLGLYICKVLVEGQKGAIGIEPRTQGGTVVWYTIPKA